MFNGSVSSASKSDVARLREITNDAVTEKVTATHEEKISIVDAVNRHIDEAISLDDAIFLKATKDNEIAGFIIFKDHQRLSDLFVDPTFHGCGIGRALFDTALERLDKHDYLDVYAAIDAVGFYKKLGFSECLLEPPLPDFMQPMRMVFSANDGA